MMTTNSDTPTSPGVNYFELTFALMGGALMWLLRLVVNSSLVDYSCRIGATWPLWLTTAVATLISVAALVASRKYHRMASASSSEAVGHRPAASSSEAVGHSPGDGETARWLGLLAIMFNVLAIAGILLETAPVAVLDVCQGFAVP